MKSWCPTLVPVFSHSRCQCWALLALMAHYSRHVADTKLLKTKLAIRVQSLGSPGGRQDSLRADHRQQPRGGLRQLHLHSARPRPVRQPRDHHPTGIRVLRVLIRPRISGGPKPSIILQMPNSQILTTTTNGGRENSQSRVIIWTICIRKGFCNLVPFTLSRPRPWY